MSNFFFDSSALVKRYIVEQGTNWIRSLTATSAGNTMIVSQVFPIEVVSAAMRRPYGYSTGERRSSYGVRRLGREVDPALLRHEEEITWAFVLPPAR